MRFNFNGLKKVLLAGSTLLILPLAAWTSKPKTKEDVLIKLAPGVNASSFLATIASRDTRTEVLSDRWVRVQAPRKRQTLVNALKEDPSVEFIQPNYAVKLIEDYRIQDPLRRSAFAKAWARQQKNQPAPLAKPDNLDFMDDPTQQDGDDPEFSKQWGMNDIGASDAWKIHRGSAEVVVAVIDTGVDYTHEDLLPNMWRNPGESGLDEEGRPKASNGIDDDGNGFVDDVVGWDFVSNDNKPYDLYVDPSELLTRGGNPGHGTHCAGNVAARGQNSLGISGVAPNVKIMALRFLSEKGGGTTADAIKSIRYAVDNGAKVLSNSWGSEGENPNDPEGNQALRDAVQYAQDKGVLFVAAAGNGHWGRGYDNDTDPRPAYPASYDHDIIISVAALNNQNALGSFSNWGLKSVDIGAPGVAVFSTTVGGKYSDKVIEMGGFEVTWDGTSMAAPHVSGAAALYWSMHPQKTWQEVKAAILGSAQKIPALENKSVSGGKLDVRALMNTP